MKKIKPLYQYTLFSAVVAFILWGGWAYYINSINTIDSGIMSGVVQGTASFTTTIIMTFATSYLYNYFETPLFKLILPAVICIILISIGLIAIHFLIGTPYILYTISPGLTTALLYCLYTSYKLDTW